MRSISCSVGQSFVIESTEGRTRLTVLSVEECGVRMAIEEACGAYREVLVATDRPTAGPAIGDPSLLTLVG